MIRTNPKERPSINQVLQEPILKERIERFLSATVMNKEFSHTVIHLPPAPGQLVPTLRGHLDRMPRQGGAYMGGGV